MLGLGITHDDDNDDDDDDNGSNVSIRGNLVSNEMIIILTRGNAVKFYSIMWSRCSVRLSV